MTKPPQFGRLTRVIREQGRATTDFKTRASLLLQAVCRWFHCEWGSFWYADPEGIRLNPIATWREPSLAADQLLANTQGKSLHKDEGNAGIVWRTGKPKCASDLVLEMCLPRSLDAKAAGLAGGIWIPIRRKKTTVGVIELLGTRSWTNSPELLEELEHLGEALGDIFE